MLVYIMMVMINRDFRRSGPGLRDEPFTFNAMRSWPLDLPPMGPRTLQLLDFSKLGIARNDRMTNWK